MHMVFFSIELHQFGIEVVAHVAEDGAQIVYHLFGEHTTAIFCDEDQMHMHQENAVSAVSNVLVVSHRPSIIEIGKPPALPGDSRSLTYT